MAPDGVVAPPLQIKENMFGDAVVDIKPVEQNATAKVDPADTEGDAPVGVMRKTDSWQLSNTDGKKKGMHVTFQV